MPNPEDRQRPPPMISYTTRMHIKRRLRAIDYKFLGALLALVLLTLLIVRYAR